MKRKRFFIDGISEFNHTRDGCPHEVLPGEDVIVISPGIPASRTMGLLPGESVNPGQLKDIRRRVESDPAVERAGNILTMYMGPHDLLVNMGVCFNPGTTAEQMHEAIHRMEANLHRAYPETNRVYIDVGSLSDMAMDPAHPNP
ncbi:MAG: cation transporter dimerization domain-containing protein [Methanoregula sp.]|nr:cation transporter dimerization domain-containing protein [Methanoregula sp.]